MATFLKAAINGARSPDEHPALPVSAEAIARDAQAAVAAGATAVHLHIRDAQGRESLAPEDAARCLTACRQAVPSTPLGVSTGAWIVPDVQQRLTLIRQWEVLPDFASVNFHEDGAEDIARLLFDRGVGIELGLSTAWTAARAIVEGWGKRCLRILLEPEEEEMSSALATVQAIERVLDRAVISAPRLLHGSNAAAWDLLVESAKRGYQCRIGLEDTLQLPTGEPAASNAQMVSAALKLMAR